MDCCSVEGRRQVRAQERRQVAADEDVEDRVGPEPDVVDRAVGSDDTRVDTVRVEPRDDRRQVGHRVVRDSGAGLSGAELREHPGDRRERRGAVDVGPVRRHRRVEDQTGNVGRVLLRIAQRDLRPVGRAVEDQLVVAERLPDRLDVGDRVIALVQTARRAELRPAGADERRLEDVRIRELGTAERTRRSGPTLVEDDQIACREGRAHLLREVCGERDRRLPGSAGEPDDRLCRSPCDRNFAFD